MTERRRTILSRWGSSPPESRAEPLPEAVVEKITVALSLFVPDERKQAVEAEERIRLKLSAALQAMSEKPDA